jgi:hypothetical protein
MAINLPSNPTNGQETVINGITYVYSTATSSWTKKTINLVASGIANTPAGGVGATNVQAAINELDTETVKLTGDQTVAGVKTFSSNPRSSATQGTNATDLTRKDYVDAQRDTRVAKSGDTVTGTLTVNGTVNGTAVTQNAADNTAGRLLKVGDFGVGRPINYGGSVIDPSSLLTQGTYVGFNWTGVPRTGVWAHITVFTNGNDQLKQEFRPPAYDSVTKGGVYSRFSGNWGATWTDWVMEYNQRNILGTVSQSGGVPTGAIIERGSNDDGSYIKYADGTMICTRRLQQTIQLHAGGNYVINTPAAFSAPPTITVTGGSAGDNFNSANNRIHGFGQGLSIHNNTISVTVYNMVDGVRRANANEMVVAQIIAVGRWY